jgi:hypothetical protein
MLPIRITGEDLMIDLRSGGHPLDGVKGAAILEERV